MWVEKVKTPEWVYSGGRAGRGIVCIPLRNQDHQPAEGLWGQVCLPQSGEEHTAAT